MERLEYDIVSEVSRVVDNYNAIIEESVDYDGSGRIMMVSTPDDALETIDHVLVAMQNRKVELEKIGESDIAERVNHCVLQIHDLKEELE